MKPVDGTLDELARCREELVRARREIEALKAEVVRLTVRDPLTGLLNRLGLVEASRREMDRAIRKEVPVAVLMLHVDHLKAVNERRGHQAGDEVLATVGHRLAAASRTTDVVARYGDGEFLMLLSEAGLDQGLLVGERLRAGFHAEPVAGAAGPIPVTLSVGVAVLEPGGRDLEAVVSHAEAECDRAKSAGGDRTCPRGLRESPGT
jgi:diguanylate cyclase (GGDEF)-like protein